MGSDAHVTASAAEIVSKLYPETIEEVDRLCVSATPSGPF